MIKLTAEKNNKITNFIINGNKVTINDSNGKLIREMISENDSEKAILRNIIFSNYDSQINILSIT